MSLDDETRVWDSIDEPNKWSEEWYVNSTVMSLDGETRFWDSIDILM